MSIFLFFIILLVLVLVHEFGHFIVAKKTGIRVDEFGFGFPPRLFGVKKGETEYTFNLLPFGGFVKIFGENPDDESLSGPDASRSMVKKPRYIQAAVLFAGVAFNFLLAWLLLATGFIAGLPSSASSDPNAIYDVPPALTITSVAVDSPAAQAGLVIGDEITAVRSNDASIENVTIADVQTFVSMHGDKEVTIVYERQDEPKSVTLIPKDGLVDGHAGIGISMDMIGVLKLPVHRAFWEGLKLTSHITAATAVSLISLVGDAIVGHADISTLTGPVGLVGVVGDAYAFGLIHLISLAAVISINLAVINLIPFPALDGGRLLFLLIEKIKGSPIRPKIANIANIVGFGLLIGLMLLVTYHDIVRLVR